MKVDPRFKDTEFVIEADDFARQTLWERFSTEALYKTELNTIRWEQDGMGWMPTIGHVNNMPVCVAFAWAKLNGVLVVFYNPCSRIVDHEMVDDYMKKYCNPQYDHGRRAHCDANNFHHVISYIRDTEAKNLLAEARTHVDEGNPDDAAHLLARIWRDYPYRYDDDCEKLNKEIKGMKQHPGAKLPARK